MNSPELDRRKFIKKVVEGTVFLPLAGSILGRVSDFANAQDTENEKMGPGIVLREKLSEEDRKMAGILKKEINEIENKLYKAKTWEERNALGQELYIKLLETGRFGNKIKDPNAGGIVDVGSLFDFFLKENWGFLESLKHKVSGDILVEEELNKIIRFWAENFSPRISEEVRLLITDKIARGYICGYYEYCPPAF